MNTYGHHSQGCKEAGGCFYYKKRVYLISGCPGFPGDTVAVKEPIGGLVEMQESHQFGHTGFRDGVISCSLWVVQNSYGAAFTGVHCWLNVKQRSRKGRVTFELTFSSAGLVLWDFEIFLRGSDFELVITADACCCAPLLTTRMLAFLPFLDGDVSSSTCICMIPWYWK